MPLSGPPAPSTHGRGRGPPGPASAAVPLRQHYIKHHQRQQTHGRVLPSTMGNGASAAQVSLDGEPLDLTRLKTLLPELRHQLKQRDTELERCQLELERCLHLLHEKDSEIEKLKAEVHKLKSVLQATVHKDGKPDILSTIHEEAAMAGNAGRNKKQGVSGESSAQSSWTADLKRHEKDFRFEMHPYIKNLHYAHQTCL